MIRAASLLLCVLASAFPQAMVPPQQVSSDQAQGLFRASTDIGSAQHGFTIYNAAAGSYEVMGGGNDVWGTADDFRFVWTQVSGDASLSADLHINAPTSYRISKGMLMFRQSLDPGSPYADIAIHADGHITLQYRLTQGGETRDVTLPEHNVAHLRIDRRGNTFTVHAGTGSGPRKGAPSVTVPMQGPVYVGLGVCSHNVDALQSVTFSKVDVQGSAQ
jgi:TolB protein